MINIDVSEEDVRLVARVAHEQRINAMNTTDTYALREFSVRLCNAKHTQASNGAAVGIGE